jgi:hypothetical protein
MTVFSWAVHLELLFKLMFMNRPAWQIQNAGADQSVAGGNQKWFRSIRQLMISSLKQLN